MIDAAAPHKCPVPGCQRQVPAERLMCPPHWAQVPAPLQRTIYRLWNHGKPQAGHAEACASAVEQVASKVAA